jgi:Peptidase M15
VTSEHFSDAELACHHCGVNACTSGLRDALEAVRTNVGVPIIIDDAYRCLEHNAAVGGVPNSEYTRGIDVVLKKPAGAMTRRGNPARGITRLIRSTRKSWAWINGHRWTLTFTCPFVQQH